MNDEKHNPLRMPTNWINPIFIDSITFHHHHLHLSLPPFKYLQSYSSFVICRSTYTYKPRSDKARGLVRSLEELSRTTLPWRVIRCERNADDGLSKHFSRSHPLPLDSSFTPYPSTSSSVMLLLVSQNNLVSHLCISYPAAVLCIYSCPCCIFAQHSVQYIYYTYPVNYILLFSRRPLKLNLFTTHLPSFAAVPLFITVPWTLTWNEMKWKDNREIISWEDRAVVFGVH